MNATPVDSRGEFGSAERTMSIFFPKQLKIWSSSSWSMWVSWTARIAILNLFRVLFIMDHFSRPVMLLEGAEKPFMLIVAMLIFAFILCFRRWLVCVSGSPGEGGRGWAPGAVALHGGRGVLSWFAGTNARSEPLTEIN